MEAASVEAVRKKLSGTVDVVGVAWAGDDESYEDFVERHSLTFPNVSDTPGEIYRRYGVAGQPGWAFVARDGTATTERGAFSEAELEEILGELAAS